MTESLPPEPPPAFAAPIAALFDLDGTLVDSERTWLDAVRDTIEAAGVHADAELLASFEGESVHAASVRLSAVCRLREEPDAVAEALETRTLRTLEQQLNWQPGAHAALDSLRTAGIPLALVTSSSRRWFEAVARRLDLSMFDHVVTASDLELTKPHPAPYLRAAQLLGVAPERCIVFEDSQIGTSAAVAAGCHVVLVRPGSEQWISPAHTVIPDLVEVSGRWVREALASARTSPAHTTLLPI